jgi:hypothetical protein
VTAVLLFLVGPTGRPDHEQQHGCHHDTKVKPEAATAVVKLLMMGVRTPETRWAVNKRHDNKLEKLLHLFVDLFELLNYARTYKFQINIAYFGCSNWTPALLHFRSLQTQMLQDNALDCTLRRSLKKNNPLLQIGSWAAQVFHCTLKRSISCAWAVEALAVTLLSPG